MPEVSVIMPVFNTKEEFLRKAVESILNQTYKDFEFIIVNDGSENNAEEVILSYKDERINYFKQSNAGAAASRNNAIKIAAGKYIAIVDSDDIYYNTRLEKMVDYLDKHPDISLVGTWYKINNKIIRLPEVIGIVDLLADCCTTLPLMRKSHIEKYNLYYDESLICAEDYDLYARTAGFLKIANIQEALFDYRVYISNTSTTKREERIISSFKVQDKILKYLSSDEHIRKKILDIAYSKKNKTYGKEKIFSIKNLYKNWTKYKMITLLGMEILVPLVRYRK